MLVNSAILPGCLRWKGEEERAFSACHRLHSCPSPRHPNPRSGFGPGHPEMPPCPCDSLCACLQKPGSLWALDCAWALGNPGSPSHRHSPPCIYWNIKGKGRRKCKAKKKSALLCNMFQQFIPYNSPAAIVEIKANGDFCALGDRPQWVDV